MIEPGQYVDAAITIQNIGNLDGAFNVEARVVPAGGTWTNYVGRFRANGDTFVAVTPTIASAASRTITMWIGPWWDGQVTFEEASFDVIVRASYPETEASTERRFSNALWHPLTAAPADPRIVGLSLDIYWP
jgi:hypothetical protein